jgi:ribonuclease inhibitor
VKIEIDGHHIHTETEFHSTFAIALNLPGHYGKNLDALGDVLSADIERPLVLIWKEALASKGSMGDTFDRVVEVLRRIEDQDVAWGLAEKFELQLV